MAVSLQGTEVWQLVRCQRERVIELLSGLDPADWAQPSLCTGWTVKDVTAHLTMLGLGWPTLIAAMVRHPGSTNHMIKYVAIELAQRWSTEEILTRLRAIVGQQRHFPGLTDQDVLVDIIDHGYDVAIPVGHTLVADPGAVALAADRVISYRGRGNAKVFRALPWQGYTLTAIDHGWQRGSGPEVSGTMVDLFLLLTGRTARVGRLEGAGAARLRSAIGS